MDNLEVAVGMSSGGVVDERSRRSRLPAVLTVLAVALPLLTAVGSFLTYRSDEWRFVSGWAKFGRMLEFVAPTACVGGLLVAAASFLRRPSAVPVTEVVTDA